MKKIHLLALAAVALFAAACSQPVKEVRSATTQAIKVDTTLDAIQDEAYIEYLAPTRAELDKIMDGDIQEIIDACIAADQAKKLAKMNE